ncbi:MAG: ATP-binding protein [Treponema sp.]|jgi:signal transduction histidine kinase|nr:ATP-binding protein [Treponema sp.]
MHHCREPQRFFQLPVMFVSALLIFAFPALYAAPAPQKQAAGIISILEQWMDVEKAFYSGDSALPDLFAAFGEGLEHYISSPLFWQYEGATLLPGDQKNAIRDLAAAFAEFSAAGQQASAEEAAKGIRAALVSWQYFESDTLDTVFSRTYFFFVIFALIITALVFFLWRLYQDLVHSRIQEQGAAAFSRAVIIAQETERSRISMELHDTVLQDLARLKRLTEESGGTGSADLLKMEDDLLKALRSVCQTIMPPDFSRLYLLDSLYALCTGFEERTGIPCRAGISEGLVMEGLTPELQLQCYRIIQEALANIEKHAHAENAFLTLRNGHIGERMSLLVFVSDDGAGMKAATGHSKAFSETRLGIRGMYERIAILNGTLSFDSDPGHGLTVRIEIPLNCTPILPAASPANSCV